MQKLTGLILAGGQNRRFPTLKAFIKRKGTPIILRTLHILNALFDEVLISTNDPGIYFPLGYPMIGDIYPSKGPMVGIFSGLINARNEALFVVACDMPFIMEEMVKYLMNKYNGQEALVCAYGRKIHPLFGIYNKKIIPYMEETIIAGKTYLTGFIKDINALIISEEELKTIDPKGLNFVNINTPEDYSRYKNLF